MRKVLETRIVKTVRKNGKTYEFGHVVEPEFISSRGERYPELRQTWARVHNGYEWTNLHYIVTEH